MFRLRGQRQAKPKHCVLPFEIAAELRALQVRRYVNGIYQGTSYDFRWCDGSGRQLISLHGQYFGEKANPKAGHAFHFAAAAEIAWSEHFLERAQRQLATEGSIAFRVDQTRVVRVGPGFLEFHFGGEPVRVNQEEIGQVTLGNGTFAFKHRDSKWYRSAGKYSFRYGNMANGKAFLLALDKLMGYRWD